MKNGAQQRCGVGHSVHWGWASVGCAPLKCGETEEEFVLSGEEGCPLLSQKYFSKVLCLFISKASPAQTAFSRMLSFYF